MKYFVFFFALFLGLPQFGVSQYGFAQKVEFELFYLEVPIGYRAEEVSLGEGEGVALTLESEETKSSATIIYDSLRQNSFNFVLEQYKELFEPVSVQKNEEIDGEAYIIKFVHEEIDSVAYIFNEQVGYTLYVVQGEDSILNSSINSLEWKE